MDGTDIRNLGEAARVTEKMADVVGDIILQLMQKQDYVEQMGVKALLNHVRDGGRTLTTCVSEERAEDFKELLREAHIPFVEIAHRDPDTKEGSMFFVYRDSDQGRMKQVLKKFALQINRSCHEVDLKTFENLTEGKSYGSVGGMTREEVYAFREAATGHDIHFCVTADGPMYAILADDTGKLKDAVADMAYCLAGERGHGYRASLEKYIRQREDFDRRIVPEQDGTTYLVDAKNPRNFISVNGGSYITHSVEHRDEKLPDGRTRKVLYDARHTIYYGMDKEKLRELAEKFTRPVIVSPEDFPLVQGISSTGEAVLAEDFVKQYVLFTDRMKDAKPDLGRVPRREPLYSREKLMGYGNLPLEVVAKVREAHIPDVFCDGGDIAFVKEAEPKVDAILQEYLYRDMTREQRKEAEEKYRSPEENRAAEFMLSMESLEMAALHSGQRLPEELMNDTQREAVRLMEKKEVREQTMDRAAAGRLREMAVDRKLAQDVER